MAGLSLNDLGYVQMLNTLNNRINDSLDNSDDQGQNTVIQYFEAPYENVTLASTANAWAKSGVTTDTTSDNVTLSASVLSTANTLDDLVWTDGTIDAGWVWSYGAEWF